MIGINNNSNICYINVVIQLLFNIKELLYYIKKIKVDNEIINELINIFDLLEKSDKSIDIDNFLLIIEKYAINNNVEEYKNVHKESDANEFLLFILNIIHKIYSHKVNIKYIGEIKTINDKLAVKSIQSINNNFKNNYSFIINLFYGQNISIYNNKVNFELFNNLFLNINDNDNNIIDCINNFIKDDKINNKIKKIRFWYFPKYLIISFNRFNNFNKNNKLIDYPIKNFNLNSYSKGYKKDNIFNLISVINHSGNLYNGHYYMYSIINNEYYLFNDNIVEKVNEINKNDTYMLIYKKL